MATAEVLPPSDALSAADGSRRFDRHDLDSLRFCAVVAVYVCHSIPNNVVAASSRADGGLSLRFLAAMKDSGNFGVCLSFALSSFLITELLRRKLEGI